ncbi:serine hydroxymethyltransferase [Candidatus Uhrbacteria bacterium]|nr:serine hydroxymethyltransferase [Candidatus Uhrbacteria bacterium]MBI4598935.1 serine hydroxymethyltransferase [Candidatus Uhrbacteria bacterium]
MHTLSKTDPEIAQALENELVREREGLEMIPSENVVSRAVLEALGSVGTNKYSEGFPGKRYYGGNACIDVIENLARERAKTLFGVTHANVQPYSGSPANMAACFALLEPGDKLMGLNLTYGGHLTHGWKVNFSGVYYQAVQYVTSPDGWIDYDALAKQVLEEKPKLLFVGATAYPRIFEWEKLQTIARSVDAYLVADIAHIAGLVVGGAHPSPVGFADVITTTTHKTLRGPRGAMILCNGEPSEPMKAPPEKSRKYLPTMIDRAVFPGLQGGPHNHQTAAIAVALKEAAAPEFKTYAHQIVKNAKALAEALTERGFNLVTGGTDNHLLLADLTNKSIGGADAERALDKAGITVNKNTVPNDPRKPYDPSGIRLGTPPLTTRGMKEEDMRVIAGWMDEAIKNWKNEEVLTHIRHQVKELTDRFPLYPGLSYLSANR